MMDKTIVYQGVRVRI